MEPCNPGKCECCCKSIVTKFNSNQIFVSDSVQANLEIDDFNEDTLNEHEYLNNKVKDSYDNDYYLMNEFLSKTKVEEPVKSRSAAYFYFYCNAEKYSDIFKRHFIKAEPMFIEGELSNAIILLDLPPDSDSLLVLNEIFEKNTPVDRKRIERCIMLNKESIDKNKEHLIQINKHKFLFKRSIILDGH